MGLRKIFHNGRELRAGWRVVIFCALFLLIGQVMRIVLEHSHLPDYSGLHPMDLIIGEGGTLAVSLIATAIMGRFERRSLAVYGIPRGGDLFGWRFWIGVAWGVAMPSVIMVSIWTFVGINSLYFLAGLQNIPHEVNEAAAIDGAGRLQSFWYVTLPMLRPTLLFVIIQATIFSYQVFDLPYLLTGGGPSDASLTVVIYLYQSGFQQFKLGYAAAIGYSLGIISIVLSLIQLRVFRRWSEV